MVKTRTEAGVQVGDAELDELRSSATVLMRDHYHEISLDQGVPLDVDWLRLQAADKAGNLICLGAWVGGQLVGYSVNFVARHSHYNFLVCFNDALFVTKPFRQTRAGVELMDQTIERARSAGCERMAWHAKDGSVLDRILTRDQAYRVQDIVHVRDI